MSESDDARDLWRPGGGRPAPAPRRRSSRRRPVARLLEVEPVELTPEQRQIGRRGVEQCRAALQPR